MRFSSENVYRWKYNEAKKLGYVTITFFKRYIRIEWAIESYFTTDTLYFLYLINIFLVFIG